MSQVRKLLKGNLVPKAQQGYKFKLDSQEYNVTEDQLKEIDNQIALLDPQHRRFLGNWTNAIKSGNSSGNRASNTVTMNMISGIDGKDIDRLKRQKGSFWESLTPKDSYYAKEAINAALTITASVLGNTPAKKSEEASKTKVEKSLIDLDFNEKDGKKYLSPTSEQNISARKRISDLLAHLQAGNNSTYDYSAYNTDAISSWLNGLEGDDKYKAGNDYFNNNLWIAMGNPNSNYTYDPDVDDLLKMFGINYGLTAPVGNVGSAGSTTGSSSIGSGTVSSGTTGASTGNTKVGDIITVLDKDYKVTGFKDNGDPILEEIVNDVENNENQTEVETEQQEVNSNWNPEIIEYAGPMTGIGPKYGLTYTPVNRSLELMEVGTVTLPFDRWGRLTGRVKQRLMKDKNGTLYSIGEDGIICLINSDYVKDILAGKQITYNDWHKNTKVFVRSRKDGGTISKSKTDSFKSKFGNVVKGQDGILTPKIVISSDSSAASKPLTKRVDELGRILVEDENGNVLIIDNKQEPIPEEIANSVARPIDPNQKTIDDFTEASSKPGPAVIQPPFYIKNPPIQYPTDPEAFSTRIGNVEENKPIVVPQVPLTEQKTVSVKTKENKSFNDLINILKQLVDKKQRGGIIKMQNGGNPLYNWQIKKDVKTGLPTSINIHNDNSDSKYNLDGTVVKGDASFDFWDNRLNGAMPKTWNQLESEWEAYKKRNLLTANTPTTTVTINGKPQTIIQKPVGMRLESGLENSSAYTVSNNDGIRRTSSIVSSDEEPDEVGGYPMNIQDRSKHLIPLISLVRFGINAGLQRKYRDTAKKAIEAGRFNEQPAVLNTPRNDNPALDRALQQIQSERMYGVKPVTSDLIANNAILNQREAQLWDREQDIIGKRSQADWEAKKEALNIMNQNIVNQTTTANSNRARNAAINSALYNPELEFIQRRGQSIENLGLEIQNNIKQDRNIILSHQRDLELQKETNILNNKLDTMFPGGRRAWDLLSDDEKLNYTDYADFLRKKYPEKWNMHIDTINKLQSAYTNNVSAWMYENGLNYSYPTFLTGRQSPIGYKKGGYLRGSTRYTMEPDERIWVDNNKATHAAISKLSESTIKLLLRALK